MEKLNRNSVHSKTYGYSCDLHVINFILSQKWNSILFKKKFEKCQ